MKPNISSAPCGQPSTREPGSTRRSQSNRDYLHPSRVISLFLTSIFSQLWRAPTPRAVSLSGHLDFQPPFCATEWSLHLQARFALFPLVFSSHPPQPCELQRVDLQPSLPLGRTVLRVRILSSARWSAAWAQANATVTGTVGEDWGDRRGASAVGQARVNAPHLPRGPVSSSRQLQMLCLCFAAAISSIASIISWTGRFSRCLHESLGIGTVSRPHLASTRAFGDSITTLSRGPTAATAPTARRWHVSDLSTWVRTRHQAAHNRRGVRSFSPKQDPMGLSPSNPFRFCDSPTIAMTLNRRFGGLDSGQGTEL
jgi:hypothetical protein